MDNPLRQVVINTHSPEAVGLVPDDAILFASPRIHAEGEAVVGGVEFLGLAGTWRKGEGKRTVDKGTVLEFLNALPVALREAAEYRPVKLTAPSVANRDDIRQLVFRFPVDQGTP